MGVTLERVQNKFACIIGELCSEPVILSKFAIWLDLRLAEYKAKGAIQLDCSGDSPDPGWLKGHEKPVPVRESSTFGEEYVYDQPPDRPLVELPAEVPISDVKSTYDTSLLTERLSPDVVVVKEESDQEIRGLYPVSLHRVEPSHTRKRSTAQDLESSPISYSNSFPPSAAKVGRFSEHLPSTSEGETANQSLISIISEKKDDDSAEIIQTSDPDFNITLIPTEHEQVSEQSRGDNSVTFSPQQLSPAASQHLSPSASMSADDSSSLQQLIAFQSPEASMSFPRDNNSINSESQHSPEVVGHSGTQQQSTPRGNRPLPQADTSGRTGRFAPVSEGMIAPQVRPGEHGEGSLHTARKTLYDVKLVKEFLRGPDLGENREVYDIPPSELNKALCKFFVCVRKANGDNYEPTSLRSMLASIERYLKKHKYGHSLTSDISFYTLRETIKFKQTALKRDGKGNLPNKSEPATEQEIDRLWESGQLGSHSPVAIINSMWFYITVHFNRRSHEDHRRLSWGDVSLHTDDQGREYLELSERQTNSRTQPGVNDSGVSQVTPRMWDVPHNIQRCPVQIYKQYARLRPPDFCGKEDPFYIAINPSCTCGNPGEPWFRHQPIGKNKIGSIMKKMAINANLSEKKLTNRSALKGLL